jgi:hypothetical protein
MVPMSERQYFVHNEKDEVELDRLRLLEGFYDPTTIRHLDTIDMEDVLVHYAYPPPQRLYLRIFAGLWVIL